MRRTPASALPASLLAACALIAFADSPPAFFENMAAGSGIDFVLQNSRTPEKHQVETNAGGVALLDYDGDGKLDIFFANGAPQPALKKTDASY